MKTSRHLSALILTILVVGLGIGILPPLMASETKLSLAGFGLLGIWLALIYYFLQRAIADKKTKLITPFKALSVGVALALLLIGVQTIKLAKKGVILEKEPPHAVHTTAD